MEGGGLKEGEVIGGRYRLLRKLGQGGEGSVYLARHLATGALWAVKILPKKEGSSELHELQVSKKLRHPGVLQATDLLEDQNFFYLIMEYIPGGSLKEKGNLSADEFLEIACGLSEILAYLHSEKNSVLHLDLKPSNILLREDGSPVLIDFGGALRKREEQEMVHMGTRGYAAPEQYDPLGTADERTDIYGFGAAMYSVFYGKIYEPEANRPWIQEKGKTRKSGKKWEKKIRKILVHCLKEKKEERISTSRELHLQWKKILRQKRREEKQRQYFMAAGILAGVMALTAYSLLHFPGQSKEEASSHLLAQAEYLGFEQAVHCYEKVILEHPQNGRAYQGLLSRITEDGSFSLEEEEILRKILYENYGGQGQTVLEELQKNAEAYGNFAYETGIAYWYYFEGSGGRSAAASWFEEAEDFGKKMEKEPLWIEMAAIHARIGSYYGKLLAGDEQEKYLPLYWEDLSGLYRSEKLQTERIHLQIENELLDFMILHFHVFTSQEDKRKEAETIIEEIIEEIIREIQEEDGEKNAYDGKEEERQALYEKARQAREAVGRVFQVQRDP